MWMKLKGRFEILSLYGFCVHRPSEFGSNLLRETQDHRARLAYSFWACLRMGGRERLVATPGIGLYGRAANARSDELGKLVAGKVRVKPAVARFAAVRIKSKNAHDVALDNTARVRTMDFPASAKRARPTNAVAGCLSKFHGGNWVGRHGYSFKSGLMRRPLKRQIPWLAIESIRWR